MKSYKEVYEALVSLLESDKKLFNEIMLSHKDKLIKDPLGVILISLKEMDEKYTEGRLLEFQKRIAEINNDDFIRSIIGNTTLFTNNQYINWLVNFTVKNDYVESSSSEYRFENFSELDKTNLYNLHWFYKGVEDYARHNQIEPYYLDSYSSTYIVRYNNVFLKVSVYVHGGGCSCSIYKDLTNEYFIDFNDLMKYYQYKENDKGTQRTKKTHTRRK